jgi:cyclopropane-fatty-acyl-phospholipid synthase
MEGWWDAEALDEFFTRIHRADVPERLGSFGAVWLALKGRIFNLQAESRSGKVAETHYDLGNDIYEAMLDRRMQYTCGYWKDARHLDEAQENKWTCPHF